MKLISFLIFNCLWDGSESNREIMKKRYCPKERNPLKGLA